MRHAIAVTLLLAGCGGSENPPAPQANVSGNAEASLWDIVSSGEGTALVVADEAGKPAMRLFCAAGANTLLVNLPAFDPIGSEERLSFGQGGEVVALVADTSGDQQRGGVSGEGPVPDDLIALLSGKVSASYGAQVSGPHPTPPASLVNAFAGACSDGGSSEGEAPSTPADPPTTPASTSPCLVQDGRPVPANSIRAIGTEPFWGARVEGRCVTYSHPEDQSGTRVWTKFSGTAANGSWTGSLGGKPFVMRTRPRPGCSDGMSDNRYPIAVSLTVGGEQRSGCAEPR